ncbi:MAG: hypothetical protein U1D30_04850 [Planctomycetota bacterium]
MRSAIFSLLLLLAPAANGGLIVNEYNAVGSTRWLDSNNAAGSTASDTTFGRVQGNGGNWIELVVTSDHMDVRNWELWWYENDAAATGAEIWDPTRTLAGVDAQGKIVFSNDDFWSDLRQGTILTITEQSSISTVNAQGQAVVLDLSTNLGFSPHFGDWHVNVSTLQEASAAAPLLTTISNLTTYVPGSFSVGNDNWEILVVDALGIVQQGPVGEAYGGFGGLNSREVGKLEFPAAPATFEDWQSIGNTGYKGGSSSSFGQPNLWSSGTFVQDFGPLRTEAIPEASSLVMMLSRGSEELPSSVVSGLPTRGARKVMA